MKIEGSIAKVTSQLEEFLMAVSQLVEFQMDGSHMAEHIIMAINIHRSRYNKPS